MAMHTITILKLAFSSVILGLCIKSKVQTVRTKYRSQEQTKGEDHRIRMYSSVGVQATDENTRLTSLEAEVIYWRQLVTIRDNTILSLQQQAIENVKDRSHLQDKIKALQIAAATETRNQDDLVTDVVLSNQDMIPAVVPRQPAKELRKIVGNKLAKLPIKEALKRQVGPLSKLAGTDITIVMDPKVEKYMPTIDQLTRLNYLNVSEGFQLLKRLNGYVFEKCCIPLDLGPKGVFYFPVSGAYDRLGRGEIFETQNLDGFEMTPCLQHREIFDGLFIKD